MKKAQISLQLFILCCDRADDARRAIDSALRQTSDQLPIIVSDNSTNDSVSTMVTSNFPGVDYRRRGHVPVLEHLNLCLDEASADYVCLFHDDDLLGPKFFECVTEWIARYPDAAAIGVNAWFVEEGRESELSFKVLGETHVLDRPHQLAVRYYSRHQLGIAPFPGYVYSMARVGDLRFDTTAGKYSDVAWLLRVADRGKIVWIAEPLMTYRLHSSNDGRSESIRDRLRLFAFFKKHADELGSGLIEDFRFFLYKKIFELHRKRATQLSPARQRKLRAYMTRYRFRRFARLDHHLSLLRKVVTRFMLHFRRGALNPPHGPA